MSDQKPKWAKNVKPSSLRALAESLRPVQKHLEEQALVEARKAEQLLKQAAKSRG